jgi:uncharacterized phiE125 gp8 family phage protein
MIGVGVRLPAGVQRYALERETDPELFPWSLEYVRDEHLRAAAGDVENPYIRRLMRTAYRHVEQKTRRALAPQTWLYSLDRFPVSGGIVLPYPPALAVTSIRYRDNDGEWAAWGAGSSPYPFDVICPVGPRATMAEIIPSYGESWPAARCHAGAVEIRWSCGYAFGSPSDFPEDLAQAMLLIIGELYKQRSDSVHAFSQNPALLRARDLYRDYVVG